MRLIRLTGTCILSLSFLTTACIKKKSKKEAPAEEEAPPEETDLATEPGVIEPLVPVEGEVIEPPVADTPISASESSLVVKEINIVKDESASATDRATAIKELVQYADRYASAKNVVIKAVRESTEHEILLAGAEFFRESKLSSPTIIETEIALYNKALNLRLKNVRYTVLDSFEMKTAGNPKLLTPTVVNHLARAARVEYDPVMIDKSYAAILARWGVNAGEFTAGAIEFGVTANLMALEALLYSVSLGTHTFDLRTNNGTFSVPSVKAVNGSLTSRLAFSAYSKGLQLWYKASDKLSKSAKSGVIAKMKNDLDKAVRFIENRPSKEDEEYFNRMDNLLAELDALEKKNNAR